MGLDVAVESRAPGDEADLCKMWGPKNG